MLAKRRKLAFTLVELLVVIAILALLVGLLMPSLAKARDLAKRTTCQTRLRHIGVAWQMYLNDSKETFPLYRTNIQYLYGGRHDTKIDKQPIRPLNPYMGRAVTGENDIEAFHCPADSGVKPTSGKPGGTYGLTAYQYYGNSYMMNSYVMYRIDHRTLQPVRNSMDSRGPYAQFRLSDATIPLDRILMAGDATWGFATNILDLFRAPWHDPLSRHANLVFLDGHVRYTKIEQKVYATGDYSLLPFIIPPDAK